MTFPSFQTDAFYEGGRSGGPVLGVSGVIGLVSTCMKSINGQPSLSYVAITAGLLELIIPEPGLAESRIGDLAKAGHIRIAGPTPLCLGLLPAAA